MNEQATQESLFQCHLSSIIRTAIIDNNNLPRKRGFVARALLQILDGLVEHLRQSQLLILGGHDHAERECGLVVE